MARRWRDRVEVYLRWEPLLPPGDPKSGSYVILLRKMGGRVEVARLPAAQAGPAEARARELAAFLGVRFAAGRRGGDDGRG